MTAERILVVILSSALAISLVISIVAGVIFVKILKQLQRIMNKTEGVVDEVGSTLRFAKNVAAPAAIAKALGNWLGSTIRKRTKR